MIDCGNPIGGCHARDPPSCAAVIGAVLWTQTSLAQTSRPGVERLYVLNCGEGVAGDISRWSPSVNVGKSMDFVDNCYLIKHTQGWLLWDTGVTDAVAAMPEGQPPRDPRMTHWRRRGRKHAMFGSRCATRFGSRCMARSTSRRAGPPKGAIA
jgi:hypothetical protein